MRNSGEKMNWLSIFYLIFYWKWTCRNQCITWNSCIFSFHCLPPQIILRPVLSQLSMITPPVKISECFLWMIPVFICLFIMWQNWTVFYKKLLENINLMYYESRLFERSSSQNLGQFNTKKCIRQEKKINLRNFYNNFKKWWVWKN